jgi:hypothetical protein
MRAGEDAIPARSARPDRTAGAADRRTPSIAISVPLLRRRWFVALKWGIDRRAHSPRHGSPPPGTPERRAHIPPPPTAVDHPLSRLGLVAISTSIAIAVATIAILAYALILE